MTTRTITYREAINEAIRLEMRRDPAVILMGEDVAGGAGTHLEEKGEEAWGGDLGVTKAWFKSLAGTASAHPSAVGLYRCGRRRGVHWPAPIAELMFVDFSACAWIRFSTRAARCATFGGKAKVLMITLYGAGFRAAASSAVPFGLCAHAGPQGRRAVYTSQRQGTAHGSHPR
jgi:pyruvate dehydrogenase E1 component beta subunit